MSRVDKESSECWLYTGALMADGYARVKDTSRDVALLVHRVVYAELVGPIAEGLVLDHLCRVRNCVNPRHLEPVTQAENTRRGVHSRLGDRTHCPVGHEMTAENTVLQRRKTAEGESVTSVCRTCKNAYYRARNAAAIKKPRARKTHCSNGHEYTPENTKWKQPKGAPRPRRQCRTCAREASRRSRVTRQARGIQPRPAPSPEGPR